MGSSSMGALRAVEVPGVLGVGHIFDLFDRGVIDSDDEVALAFDPERLVALTVPLVNVRYAAERLASTGTITQSLATRVVRAAQDMHYTERTYRHILERAGVCDQNAVSGLVGLLSALDRKKEDARLLLVRLAEAQSNGDQARFPGIDSKSSESEPQRHTRHRSARGSRQPRATGAELLVWETGDTCSWHSLVEFLVLTGRLGRHATSVMLRLLVAGARISVSVDTRRTPGALKQRFKRTCRAWGWVTPEEVQVTMNDFDLNARDIFQAVGSDALTTAVIQAVIRRKDKRFMRELKAELFLNDLALKRELMVAASVSICGGQGGAGESDVAEAEAVLCRLHNETQWSKVRANLNAYGVSDEKVDAFVQLLASARVVLRKAPKTVRDAHLGDINELPGLGPVMKPSGEDRSRLSVTAGYREAIRIRDLIGVTRVSRIDRLAELPGVFITQACRPAGAWTSSYGSGKSRTLEGAFIGGVMEELEKWAQERFCPIPVVGAYESLGKMEGGALDPASLDLPFDSEYHPGLEMEWLKCHDLIGGTWMLVPLSCMACPPVVKGPNILYSKRGGRTVFSTNGLASGFSLTEALLHATCEYIERDAAKLAELCIDNPGLERLAKPELVDLGSSESYLAELNVTLRKSGFRLSLWDITSDIQVPTIYARIEEGRRFACGWATHPDPMVAAERATLEACQSVAGTIAGGREDIAPRVRSLGRHERPRPMRAAGLSVWSRQKPTRHLEEVGGYHSNDIFAEFNWVRHRLIDAGVPHLLALDITDPLMTQAHVVRVIVPGLETNNPFYCGPRARATLAAEVVSQ
jgi:ribosomal protein S12 methylthiotransferase accessory factor